MNLPVVRVLVSERAREPLAGPIASAVEGFAKSVLVGPGEDADVAFVSRDVTGLSTKFQVLPETQRFYDTLAQAASLRWVHVHSAGADRPVYVALRQRGVKVTTSSGANANIVAQTVLAAVLSLGRALPRLQAAQRERRWASLVETGMPRDLEGQTAVIVGWGPIGQRIGALLGVLGLRVAVVRGTAAAAEGAFASTTFERIGDLLPVADWLVLACPLSPRTQGLVSAAALASLPAGARVVNVARGEVIDEPALIDALRTGRVAGAYLDVFAREPLPPDSPLWSLPDVLVTPHSAGHSDGNEERVAAMFAENLRRWVRGIDLGNLVA